ncbi:C40 family peptidase [Arcicella sp. DC2W]|uniref:C40 family peptidase n=1 Tax=Arcicella gelida TaxID=2984195 RepID=A0ABU5S637_9BACT|nr:C40 family peptidase [Arcicella sp. DC2W]MEA5403934.1 C40 family peptidase [Arcicella sp. DC2W]
MLKKALFTIFCIGIKFVSFGQFIPSDSTHKKSNYYNLNTVNNLLDFANDHLHLRYRSGGTTKKGFDCSGFVRYCFKNFGMILPHGSAAQSLLGYSVSRIEAQPSDLIFFKGHNAKGKRVGHVGIVTEVTDKYIKFIHSAWNGGVRYDYLDAAYYQKRFMGIKRVLNPADAKNIKIEKD